MTAREIREYMIAKLNEELNERFAEIIFDEITEEVVEEFLWERDNGVQKVRDWIEEYEDEIIEEYLEEVYDEIDHTDLALDEKPW